MKTKLLTITLVLTISFSIVSIHHLATKIGNEIVIGKLPTHNVSMKKIKQRMNYHGVLITERDLVTGKWYFWRDGERCKLCGN